MAHIVTGVASFLGGFAQSAARHQRGREAISREERRHRETLALDEKRRREDIARQNQQQVLKTVVDLVSNSEVFIPPEAVVELKRSLSAQLKGEGAGVSFAEGLSVLSRPKQITPSQKAGIFAQVASQTDRSQTPEQGEALLKQLLPGTDIGLTGFPRFAPRGGRGGTPAIDRTIEQLVAGITNMRLRRTEIGKLLEDPFDISKITDTQRQALESESRQLKVNITAQEKARRQAFRQKGVKLPTEVELEKEAQRPSLKAGFNKALEDMFVQNTQLLLQGADVRAATILDIFRRARKLNIGDVALKDEILEAKLIELIQKQVIDAAQAGRIFTQSKR